VGILAIELFQGWRSKDQGISAAEAAWFELALKAVWAQADADGSATIQCDNQVVTHAWRAGCSWKAEHKLVVMSTAYLGQLQVVACWPKPYCGVAGVTMCCQTKVTRTLQLVVKLVQFWLVLFSLVYKTCPHAHSIMCIGTHCHNQGENTSQNALGEWDHTVK
jgi:hypothetical protein